MALVVVPTQAQQPLVILIYSPAAYRTVGHIILRIAPLDSLRVSLLYTPTDVSGSLCQIKPARGRGGGGVAWEGLLHGQRAAFEIDGAHLSRQDSGHHVNVQ